MHSETVAKQLILIRPRRRVPATRWAMHAYPRASRAPTPNASVCSRPAPFASSPMSPPENAPTARGSPSSSTTPGVETACVSLASTGWGARYASCSRPSTTSRPAASTWSASRNASIPRLPPASSFSTSSSRSRTSGHGSSPSAPVTALLRPGDAADSRADRRSIRRRFPRRRNSSKRAYRPLVRQNSSGLAGQRLTESPQRCARGLRALDVTLGTHLPARSIAGESP